LIMYQAIIIDDEKWVIKSLISTIRDQQYFEITDEFYDGLSGLNYIRLNKPELAFVDVRLPGIGGLELLQIAQEEKIPTLFIMISGYAEFAYAQKAMFHNAIGYCLKPFSKNELMDSMQKACSLITGRKAWKGEEEKDCSTDPSDKFNPEHLTSSHKSVQKMIDYTESHYQEDISVQDAANYCSLNSNYASQLFHQETGITFIGHLTNLRISHAKWLLMYTDQNIYLIAAQVGFSDYFYFAKVFKKMTGDTPTHFRKNNTI